MIKIQSNLLVIAAITFLNVGCRKDAEIHKDFESQKQRILKETGYSRTCTELGNAIHSLSEIGVDSQQEDERGFTPFAKAVSMNCVSLVRDLIARGANVNYQSQFNGVTPLIVATQSSNLEMVGLLLEAEADRTIADRFGRLPLHLACERSYAFVALIIEGDEEVVNYANGSGMTPLLIVIGTANVETREKVAMAELLIMKSADPSIRFMKQGEADSTIGFRLSKNGPEEGETAAMFARRTGQVELADFLDGQTDSGSSTER